MKNYLIIVAGGQGRRMGTPLPKQFMLLGQRPIVMLTIERFVQALPELEIVLVLHPDYMELWKEQSRQYSFSVDCKVVAGGAERFYSVRNGLEALSGATPDGIVGVHDAVRPLVSVDVIRAVYNAAAIDGAAIPVVSPVDSVRIISGQSSYAVPRSQVQLVQTPQVFRLSLLRQAYAQPYDETFTDDASVVEACGYGISTIPGNRENIKITIPNDLIFAKQYL